MSPPNSPLTSLEDWIQAKDGIVTLVFTDVERATTLLYRTESMVYMRLIRAHRRRAQGLIESLEGRVIDMSGDAVFAAFHSAAAALRFARSIVEDSGHERVRVRVGIHHGPVHAESGGLFGRAVHFGHRLAERGSASEVWASDYAKLELEAESPELAREVRWTRSDECELKGIPGRHTLWQVA